jgi:hypothetical protein
MGIMMRTLLAAFQWKLYQKEKPETARSSQQNAQNVINLFFFN